MSTTLPPELAEHQREVKAEIKALYRQRHGERLRRSQYEREQRDHEGQ